MTFRPLNNWVLVKLDPEPPAVYNGGTIIMMHPALIRQGSVVRVGPGRTFSDGVYKHTELKVGERVAFLSAVLDTKQGHQIEGTLSEGEALIREDDVLFVIEEGDLRIEK